MKYLQLIIITFTSFLGCSNMIRPYNEGTSHSVLFTKENNTQILYGKIKINVEPHTYEKTQNVDYYAKYQITYVINSPSQQKLPLLFLAANLKNSPVLIEANGEALNKIRIRDTNDERLKGCKFIEPDKNENIHVIYNNEETKVINVKDLICFEVNFKKGKNYISIQYNSNLKSNNFGFIKEYTLDYCLYPSKYWKTFKCVEIILTLPPQLDIEKSSIGNPDSVDKFKNQFLWKLDDIPEHHLDIMFSPKISIMCRVLLTLNPLGISLIITFLLALLHYYFIKRHRINKKSYNWPLIIGNFIVPCLFYILYFFSYTLIDWTLGENALKNHRYMFFVFSTLPIAWILYAVIMSEIDLRLKNKFLKS